MGKHFNTTGFCDTKLHYMVDIDRQLATAEKLVSQGDYFVINRARQYGKTTTLMNLKKRLIAHYTVFLISFEGMTDDEDEISFCQDFYRAIYNEIKYEGMHQIPEEIVTWCYEYRKLSQKQNNLSELSDFMMEMCAQVEKPIVLMIDEVDQAGNQKIFQAFLGVLRNQYLNRLRYPAFQSVILAGVYNIKNLKLKVRQEKERQYNSPWNIAADFDEEMSFSVAGIAGMLREYEADRQTGMAVEDMAFMLYSYTSGYPFLVSRLCKIMDEKLSAGSEFSASCHVWTKKSFLEAVRILLLEKNTLFDSLLSKLEDFPDLKEMIRMLLFVGRSVSYHSSNAAIDVAIMFGLVKRENGMVVIANRMFESWLYDYFLTSHDMQKSNTYKVVIKDKNQFIEHGHLNMKLVLQKFVIHFSELFGDSGEEFLEEEGRKYFLLYLRPIINGVGNYYIEARTRTMGRTDVIVDYNGEQYVIEMKLWHGNEYNQRGQKQLFGYLEDYHLKKGYMLSFNFNKKKKIGVQELIIGDKVIIEAVV